MPENTDRSLPKGALLQSPSKFIKTIAPPPTEQIVAIEHLQKRRGSLLLEASALIAKKMRADTLDQTEVQNSEGLTNFIQKIPANPGMMQLIMNVVEHVHYTPETNVPSTRRPIVITPVDTESVFTAVGFAALVVAWDMLEKQQTELPTVSQELIANARTKLFPSAVLPESATPLMRISQMRFFLKEDLANSGSDIDQRLFNTYLTMIGAHKQNSEISQENKQDKDERDIEIAIITYLALTQSQLRGTTTFPYTF